MILPPYCQISLRFSLEDQLFEIRGTLAALSAPLPQIHYSIPHELLDYSHPSTESRILLMQLSQQLSSEDTEKLIYLMYPS